MRNGPRAASSSRRARRSVRSTEPRLPPNASATGTPGDGLSLRLPRSLLVVEVLLLFFFVGSGDDQVFLREVGSHHLVVRNVLDRLLVLDVDRLGDLRLPLATGSGGGRRLVARGVFLVGPALRADGLGLSEIIELRATVVALEFGS